MKAGGVLGFKGELQARLIKGKGSVKRVRHPLQDLKVALAIARFKIGQKISGQVGAIGTLSVKKYNAKKGIWEDHGVVGVKCVTDAGVAFMVDDWDNDATDITTFNWHDSGTGVGAEVVGDTGLGTPCGEARDSGTKSQPAANQLRTIATHTYAGTFAITEHGIFSAVSAGTLWDRTKFTSIGVESGDKIEFTYTLTITAGG